MQSFEFLIRNLSGNTRCKDRTELASVIQRYRGQSVTIADLRQRGSVHFVDVLPSGELRDSYGVRSPFDIEVRLK
ncbi:MAG: hypothetical protein OEL20_05050 [Sulfuritalea sp.]|nr:hypothetical protein [Sulfuritalea sp.]